MRIAQFLNIFLFALVAGVLWGTWFSLSRSIASITPHVCLARRSGMLPRGRLVLLRMAPAVHVSSSVERSQSC
jgi:hypothetical protein